MRCERFLPVVCLLILGFSSGCASQVQWHGYLFEPVHDDARERGLPTMVYLRSWYLPECARFENEVLTDPTVIAATRGYRNANIDFDWNKALAEGWGVEQSPAVVLLDTSGQVLSILQGPIQAAPLQEALVANDPAAVPAPTSAPATEPN